jgi:hypothetical protein
VFLPNGECDFTGSSNFRPAFHDVRQPTESNTFAQSAWSAV